MWCAAQTDQIADGHAGWIDARLRDDRHAPGNLARRQRAQVVPLEPYLTTARAQYAGGDAEHRALAGAVGADQGDDFASAYGQIDVAKHGR